MIKVGKVLLLGGTLEARNLARHLLMEKIPFIYTAATAYGANLMENQGAEVLKGPLDHEKMNELIAREEIALVVDATHPFATGITNLAREFCQKKGIPYLALERPSFVWENVFWAKDFLTAAELAFSLGRRVMLTIGSKNIAPFVERARKEGKEVLVRVLPLPESINHCLELGLLPGQIIAIQGPFSEELNLALFRHFGVEVVVSKDSGPSGGLDTKISAAQKLGLPIVVVARPQGGDGITDPEILIKKVKEIVDSGNSAGARQQSP